MYAWAGDNDGQNYETFLFNLYSQKVKKCVQKMINLYD